MPCYQATNIETCPQQLRSGLCGVVSGFQDHVRMLLESTPNAEAKEEPSFGRQAVDLTHGQ